MSNEQELPTHEVLGELPPISGYAEMRQERDVALAQIAALAKQVEELAKDKDHWQGAYNLVYDQANDFKAELAELREAVNSPETEDFFKGIELEAAHQRVRWPSEHDAGKTHADWFWLIGHLAGKCLHAAIAGDREKALHHTISTAAALANWHRAIKGASNMEPRA